MQQLLTAEELGDRKPSQLLQRMQQLLGDAGPPPEGAFVCQLFLQRMPPSVRMVLASASTTLTLPQLAKMRKMADRILEVSHVPTVAPITDPNVGEMRQLTATLTRLVATLDTTLSHSREISDGCHQSRSPSRSAFPAFISSTVSLV